MEPDWPVTHLSSRLVKSARPFDSELAGPGQLSQGCPEEPRGFRLSVECCHLTARVGPRNQAPGLAASPPLPPGATIPRAAAPALDPRPPPGLAWPGRMGRAAPPWLRVRKGGLSH
jgi:hypothetical protein